MSYNVSLNYDGQLAIRFEIAERKERIIKWIFQTIDARYRETDASVRQKIMQKTKAVSKAS